MMRRTGSPETVDCWFSGTSFNFSATFKFRFHVSVDTNTVVQGRLQGVLLESRWPVGVSGSMMVLAAEFGVRRRPRNGSLNDVGGEEAVAVSTGREARLMKVVSNSHGYISPQKIKFR